LCFSFDSWRILDNSSYLSRSWALVRLYYSRSFGSEFLAQASTSTSTRCIWNPGGVPDGIDVRNASDFEQNRIPVFYSSSGGR